MAIWFTFERNWEDCKLGYKLAIVNCHCKFKTGHLCNSSRFNELKTLATSYFNTKQCWTLTKKYIFKCYNSDFIMCGGQKEVWSPTKQLEHLQHHGEPHQGKQQGLGHSVRGFRTRDSSTTGVHLFSSNREPQLQAVRDNQQLPHKREQRPQYSLSRGDEQMHECWTPLNRDRTSSWGQRLSGIVSSLRIVD